MVAPSLFKWRHFLPEIIVLTLDFMLSAKRDSKAAVRFFRKVLKASHTQAPQVINVDKNAAYSVVMDAGPNLMHSVAFQRCRKLVNPLM